MFTPLACQAILDLNVLVFRRFARAAVGTLQQRYTHKADLAAIEKLHQIDTEFTRSQDYKRLMGIWSEDAVRFMPGSPPDVGKQAILADNEKFAAEYPGFKVLSYEKSSGGREAFAFHPRAQSGGNRAR